MYQVSVKVIFLVSAIKDLVKSSLPRYIKYFLLPASYEAAGKRDQVVAQPQFDVASMEKGQGGSLLRKWFSKPEN